MKITLHVAGAEIEVEAETQAQLVLKSGFWGQLPDKCGNCGSGLIGFYARNTKKGDYLGLKCRDCKHEFTFGQNMDGGRLFVRHDTEWQAPYSGGGNSGGY